MQRKGEEISDQVYNEIHGEMTKSQEIELERIGAIAPQLVEPERVNSVDNFGHVDHNDLSKGLLHMMTRSSIE